MAEVNLKALIGRLDRVCTRGLEGAAGQCVSRTNYEVSVEHLLLTLAEDPSADVQAIFKHFGVDGGRVQKVLTSIIEGFKTGSSGRPVFSPLLLEWFQQAWLLASLQYGLAEIRSGNLLQVLLVNPIRFGADEYVSALFEGINTTDLKAQYSTIVSTSQEQSRRMGAGTADTGAPAAAGAAACGPGCVKTQKLAERIERKSNIHKNWL